MSKVVTANTLATGTVVFLDEGGEWTHDIALARVFADADTAEEGLAVAKADEERALVVDAFVTDKGPEVDGKPKMTLRDEIRAFGPTISYLPADPVGRG